MKHLHHIICLASIVLFSVVLFSVVLFSNGPLKQKATQQTDTQEKIVESAWETKTDNRPPVAVAITPIVIGSELSVWKFQVVFDTHSGSLDDDPLIIASISDNQGNDYKPTSWDGPGPGGHHREGVLMFDAINPTPPAITLLIENVGGIPERAFTWDL